MHEDDPIDAALAALADADRAAVPSARVTRALMAAFDERAGALGAATRGEQWRWAAAAVLFAAVASGVPVAQCDHDASRAARTAMRAGTSAESAPLATPVSKQPSGARGAATEPPSVPVAPLPQPAEREARLARGAQGPPSAVSRGALLAPSGTSRSARLSASGPERARAEQRSAVELVESSAAGADANAFVELAPTTVQDVDTVRLVRVRLPEAALRHLSITPPGPPREGFVQADVLLGDDGFARAIRIVR